MSEENSTVKCVALTGFVAGPRTKKGADRVRKGDKQELDVEDFERLSGIGRVAEAGSDAAKGVEAEMKAAKAAEAEAAKAKAAE